MSTEKMVCPKCGKEVESLCCDHCGSSLADWQADLYGATVRQIAKLGGDRADADHQGGDADEVADLNPEVIAKDNRAANGDHASAYDQEDDSEQDEKAPSGHEDDWDQTPIEICQQIIGLFEWAKGEAVLEPFCGDGNFLSNLPDHVQKDWCEIKKDRDFFNYEGPQPETIITNPPFRDEAGGNNLVVPALERCLQLAEKRLIYFVNHKVFNSLTPARMKRYEDWGWGVTHLSFWDVKKWFGRYYLLVWKKAKPSILEYYPSHPRQENAQDPPESPSFEPLEQQEVDTEVISAMPTRSHEKLLEDLRMYIEDAVDAEMSQSDVIGFWERFSGVGRSQLPHYLTLLPETYRTMWSSLAA